MLLDGDAFSCISYRVIIVTGRHCRAIHYWQTDRRTKAKRNMHGACDNYSYTVQTCASAGQWNCTWQRRAVWRVSALPVQHRIPSPRAWNTHLSGWWHVVR